MRVYSPFAQLFKGSQEPNTLYVALGYRNLAPGKFSLVGTCVNYGQPTLFLNGENKWYINGIPGFADSNSELLQKISQIAVELGTSRVEFLGSSMGGFGAILLGQQFAADRIVAINPEFRLGLSHSRSSNDFPRSCFKALNRDLKLGKRSYTQLTVLYSDIDPIDCLNASLIADCDPQAILCYQGHEHHVADEIARTGELRSVLFDPLILDRPGISLTCKISAGERRYIPSTEVAATMLRAFDQFSKRRYVQCLNLLSKDQTGYRPTGASYLAGRCQIALGMLDDGLENLARAYRRNMLSMRLAHEFGAALLKSGRAQEAASVLSWINGRKINNPAAYETYATALCDARQYPQAIEILNQTININENRWQSYKILGRALREAGKHDESRVAISQAEVLRAQHVKS